MDVVNVPIKDGMSLKLKLYSFDVSCYTRTQLEAYIKPLISNKCWLIFKTWVGGFLRDLPYWFQEKPNFTKTVYSNINVMSFTCEEEKRKRRFTFINVQNKSVNRLFTLSSFFKLLNGIFITEQRKSKIYEQKIRFSDNLNWPFLC